MTAAISRVDRAPGAVPNLGTLFDAVPPERVAIIDLAGEAKRTLTYGELGALCDAVARGLVRDGVRPGDRVALLSLNRLEFIAVVFGALRAGAVPVLGNVKLPATTLRNVISAAGAGLAFVEAAFAEAVPEGVRRIDLEREFEGFLDRGPFEPVAVGAKSVSMQLYTSGSTGAPKGVLLTHAGQRWAAETLVRHRRLGPEDRALIAAPLYHKNAVVAVKTALLPGAMLVLMPRFDAARYVAAMEEHGVTMITGVPTMMRMILDVPRLREIDRNAVRVVSMGSSPASDQLLAELRQTFPRAELHLNYGTTEGGPIMFGWYHPDGKPRPPHSIGYPIPGCEYRLEGGPSANEGELWVRNPGVALGYHERPDATRERFVDGWFRTGDVLRRDADGWFYFVGRIDDMFVTGGENVFPQEVESLLERHPAIRQAAVVPVPHEIKGIVPVAFVVPRPGATVEEGEVKRFALANGPAYAHPRRVFVVDALPLTGTNKIDKAALKARAVAADAAVAA